MNAKYILIISVIACSVIMKGIVITTNVKTLFINYKIKPTIILQHTKQHFVFKKSTHASLTLYQKKQNIELPILKSYP